MLSIIIPTFNEEKYLPKLLESIKLQTYRTYEIIIADADSTDKTRSVAKEYGARVTKGGLPGAGRNNGAKIAKGDILLFLDADVILMAKNFLQKTLEEFNKRKLDVASCMPEPLSDKKIDITFHHLFNLYTKLIKVLLPHAPGFCIFARHKTHQTIGGFDEEIKLAEDHDYAKRAAKAGKFGLIRSCKIPVSVRRFEKDGRLKVAVKYLLCEMHMMTRGNIKSDIFKYRFGYTEKDCAALNKNLKDSQH